MDKYIVVRASSLHARVVASVDRLPKRLYDTAGFGRRSTEATGFPARVFGA